MPRSPNSSNARTTLVERKLTRARFIADQLANVPFIQLIALGNSVAMGTATELSDLDFFVVTAPNRLWTARFLLLLKAKQLGLSKRPGKTANQADFGFWVDETALDLGSIAIEDDVYLQRWLTTLIPLVDRGGVYDRLLKENQSLIRGTPNRTVTPPHLHLRSVRHEVKPNWIERLLFWIQKARIWADPVAQHPNPLTMNGRRVDLVTTPHMLKLHHFDQRAKIRDHLRSSTK